MTNNSFIYPRTDECNPRMIALPGMNEDYSGKEARLALAIADALVTEGCCGGGSGSGCDPGTNYNELTGLATTANLVLLAADANRKFFTLQNIDSTNSIYIRFGAAAAVGTGHLILPGGWFKSAIDIQMTQSINIIATAVMTPYFGFWSD